MEVKSHINIGNREIGLGRPTYFIAEMSANHGQSFEQAVEIIKAAKDAGADAVKLQTYTPDTITLDCKTEYFQIKGNIWEGRGLYELYGEAYTPWDWQPKLKEIGNELGLDVFSSPFDTTAVDFLERMDVPAYKIASFELVDIPLIRHAARTGKPMIMSIGMGTLAEIDEAVRAARGAGATDIALLCCTSAYPAPPEEMDLRTIPHLSQAFGVPVGLSDHSMELAIPVTAVALGACIIEKHLTLSRDIPSADSQFSLNPSEFADMVHAVRTAEKALGRVSYELTEREAASRTYRRSLFVAEDVKAGDLFTAENIRDVRPGHGLHTRHLDEIIGRRASCDIPKGTPLSWDFVG